MTHVSIDRLDGAMARDYLWREDLRQLLLKLADAVSHGPSESGRREGRMMVRRIEAYQTPVIGPENAT